MRLCYVLLSPTWGMHQYTSDLANRRRAGGDEVHVVTTSLAPRDRYAPGVHLHQPVTLTNTGFSPEGLLRLAGLRRVAREISALRPALVHVTGPHLWNRPLVDRLRSARIPVVHTLHDLHPHLGALYGRLLYMWNRDIGAHVDHLLVHGRCFCEQLEDRGILASRVTCTPLTHLFLSHEAQCALEIALPPIEYEPWALFIGRLERYKGLNVLTEAAQEARATVCMAGAGSPRRALGAAAGLLGEGIELRNHLIADAEAIDLFRRCAVVVLPYLEASQSALVAAAYFFRKPAIVTAAGALPEYVVEGVTGWIVPPGDVSALARALKEALQDPGRLAAWGQAGRAWWEHLRCAESKALDEMYRAVLA